MQTNTSFKKSLNLKTHHRSFRTWLIDLYQQSTKIVLTHQSWEKTLNTAIKTRREKSFGAKTNTWQKAEFIFKNKKRVLFLANIFCIQSDATLHSNRFFLLRYCCCNESFFFNIKNVFRFYMQFLDLESYLTKAFLHTQRMTCHGVTSRNGYYLYTLT